MGSKEQALSSMMKQQITCAICMDTLDDPHTIPCQHVFCRECVYEAFKNSNLCPLCKGTYTRRSITRNTQLAGIVEAYRLFAATAPSPSKPSAPTSVASSATSNPLPSVKVYDGSAAAAAAAAKKAAMAPEPIKDSSASTSTTTTTTTKKGAAKKKGKSNRKSKANSTPVPAAVPTPIPVDNSSTTAPEATSSTNPTQTAETAPVATTDTTQATEMTDTSPTVAAALSPAPTPVHPIATITTDSSASGGQPTAVSAPAQAPQSTSTSAANPSATTTTATTTNTTNTSTTAHKEQDTSTQKVIPETPDRQKRQPTIGPVWPAPQGYWPYAVPPPPINGENSPFQAPDHNLFAQFAHLHEMSARRQLAEQQEALARKEASLKAREAALEAKIPQHFEARIASAIQEGVARATRQVGMNSQPPSLWSPPPGWRTMSSSGKPPTGYSEYDGVDLAHVNQQGVSLDRLTIAAGYDLAGLEEKIRDLEAQRGSDAGRDSEESQTFPGPSAIEEDMFARFRGHRRSLNKELWDANKRSDSARVPESPGGVSNGPPTPGQQAYLNARMAAQASHQLKRPLVGAHASVPPPPKRRSDGASARASVDSSDFEHDDRVVTTGSHRPAAVPGQASIRHGHSAQPQHHHHQQQHHQPQPQAQPTQGAVASNPDVVVCFSKLDERQMKEAVAVGTRLGWKLSKSWSPTCSHLVVDRMEGNHCTRTIKYFSAVLTGQWVVGFDWIQKCGEVNAKVAERDYEIAGDATYPDAAKRGRLASLMGKDPLFHGMKFHMLGRGEAWTGPGMSRAQAEALIRLGGGIPDSALPPPRNIEQDLNAVPRTVVLAPDTMDGGLLESFHDNTKYEPLSVEYLMECISSYDILPIADFALRKMSDSEPELTMTRVGQLGGRAGAAVVDLDAPQYNQTSRGVWDMVAGAQGQSSERTIGRSGWL